MGVVSARLAELGIVLPSIAPASGNYVAHRLVGSLLFVSGQIPRIDGVEHFVGVVGRDVSPEDGYRAARLCALNLVARVSAALDGDLDRGRRWQMQYSFDFARVFAAWPMFLEGAIQTLRVSAISIVASLALGIVF